MADRNRWSSWVAAAGLALAGLAVYARTFSVPFVYDDIASTVDNPTIRHLWPPWKALMPPHERGPTVCGRPVLNLSLAVNRAISGDAVWSYHALNLFIHMLAGLTLYGIVRRSTASRGASVFAFAVALLWTVHPLQTEAVTYTVQRAESLMALFYLLTLYCFNRGWFKLCWLACFLGMATKEVMVSAPLMVLLYDRTFVAGSFRQAWRARRGMYLGLASTWILLAALVVGGGGNRGGSAGFDMGVKWPAYWLTQFQAVAHYLRLAIWPHPLVFDYGPFWVQNVADVLPDAVMVGLLLGATGAALWRWPVGGFLGAGFFAVLAPTSVIPGAMQMIAEHRMYLALAPVLVAIVWGPYELTRRISPRLGLALLAGAALVLADVTVRRNAVYASAFSLWSDTVAKRPANARAHTALANELVTIPGRSSDAIAHYQEALRINPDLAEAHNNLGNALAKIPGRIADALGHYDAALRINPSYAEAHYNLANALAGIPGRLADAVAQYQEALRFQPSYPEADYNLANALTKMPGHLDEAIAYYEAALRVNPNYAEAHNNLAVVLESIPGRRREAWVHYEAALRINPRSEEARENLARARAAAGK